MTFTLRSTTVQAIQWTGSPADIDAIHHLIGGEAPTELDGSLWVWTGRSDRISQVLPGEWVVRDAAGRVTIFSPEVFGEVYKALPPTPLHPPHLT